MTRLFAHLMMGLSGVFDFGFAFAFVVSFRA
jgi:hypothetical protein